MKTMKTNDNVVDMKSTKSCAEVLEEVTNIDYSREIDLAKKLYKALDDIGAPMQFHSFEEFDKLMQDDSFVLKF